jgi:predicted RecB family nuclease
MEKKLSDITREEWITFQWVDITEMGDSERMMLQRFQRTPDEMMQAMEDWEETEQFRVVKQ